MGHFSFFSTGETHDLIHELVFAFIIGTAAIGLLSQLWKPKENFAGQLVALFAWFAMILTAAITNNWVPQPLYITFGGLTIFATFFIRRDSVYLIGFAPQKINKVLFALVIIATVPFFMYATTNVGLQIAGSASTGFFGHNPSAFHGGDSTTNQELSQDQLMNGAEGMGTDNENHDQEHIALGHYRNIAVLSFLIILIGVLASFKPKGWRIAAWVAGFLPILLGLASVVLPSAESSLSLAWGIAAIVWGLVFIAVAEVTRLRQKTQKL